MHIESENKDQAENFFPKSFGFWFVSCLLLIFLAQLVRVVILSTSAPTFLNDRFAFSISLPVVFMYGVYAIVITSVIVFLVKNYFRLSVVSNIALVMILAGGLSNVLERVFFGYVVDYIFLLNGVLNVADFYIIFGAILLLSHRAKK